MMPHTMIPQDPATLIPIIPFESHQSEVQACSPKVSEGLVVSDQLTQVTPGFSVFLMGMNS